MNEDNIKKQIDEMVNKLSAEKVDEDIIIAVSNSYISKYYLDKRLDKSLPKEIKNDLKALLVNNTEKYGGIVEVHYVDSEMDIYIKNYASKDDYLYDEIGSTSDLNKIERKYADMFSNISAACKIEFRNIGKK